MRAENLRSRNKAADTRFIARILDRLGGKLWASLRRANNGALMNSFTEVEQQLGVSHSVWCLMGALQPEDAKDLVSWRLKRRL
mgnify:FL=1